MLRPAVARTIVCGHVHSASSTNGCESVQTCTMSSYYVWVVGNPSSAYARNEDRPECEMRQRHLSEQDNQADLYDDDSEIAHASGVWEPRERALAVLSQRRTNSRM